MNTGQVDDRVAQEGIARSQPRDGGPLAVDGGRHVHEGPGPVVDDDATHFPVNAAPGGNPDQVDERVRFAGFHEPQPAGALPRPRLERGTGQFAIRWLVTGHAGAVRDEVRNGLARVLPCRPGYENGGTEDESAHYRGEASGSTAYRIEHQAGQHPPPSFKFR